MSYDGFDSGTDPDSDASVFYGIPADHPAFREPEDDGDSDDPVDAARRFDRTDVETGNNVIDFPVGRYDGFVGQDHQEMGGPLGVDESRQRAADAAFLRDRVERSREAVATRAIGQRNAIAHTRSTGEGEGGGTSTGEPSLHDALAASLEQAGIQFRDEPRSGSGDNAAVDPEEILQTFLHGSEVVQERGGWQVPLTPTQPLTRAKRGIMEAPKFQEAHITGMMGGLKMNVAGTWILTLNIDSNSFDEVTKLSQSSGLALDITIKRKSRE